MYLLQQLSLQFSSYILSYAWNPTDGPSWWDVPTESEAATPWENTESQQPQTAEALAFQELNEELDGIDNDSKLVSTYTNILGKFLEKVKNGEIEWLSQEDTDFKRLLDLYTGKFDELKVMRERGQEIEHVIAHSMSQLQDTVDKGAAGKDIDKALDEAHKHLEFINKEYNESEGWKSDFFQEIWKMTSIPNKEMIENVMSKYGVAQIHQWSQETPEWSLEEQKIIQLFAGMDSRQFENMSELETVDVIQFLWNIKHWDRLKYFTLEEKNTFELWDNINISFRFNGKLNWELESWMTAWNIIPENISELQVGDIVYKRKWLQWEFISDSKDSKTPERLLIRDGDIVSIVKIKTAEEITTEKDTISKQVDWVQGSKKEILEQRLLKWLPKLDATAQKILTDSLSWKKWTEYSWWLEKRLTDLATTPWVVSGEFEKIEWLWMLWAILNFIMEMLQDPESSVSQVGDVNTYMESIGAWLSAEELKQFGNTGGQLAAWIQSIWFKKFVDKPWNCGANVWEALEAFGFKWLPTSWRDGHLWASFCRERPSQFKQFNGPVEEAPAGSIISYKTNTWGSDARQKYWHVEIAMGNNTGYYFGQKNTRPGGSNPNPKIWDYEIYVPISKVPTV